MVCKLNRDYQGNPKLKKMVSKLLKKNKKGRCVYLGNEESRNVENVRMLHVVEKQKDR